MARVRRQSLRHVAAGLLRLTEGRRWLVPLLVALGLVAFLFEGLGIYLLVPLLHRLIGDEAVLQSNRLLEWADALVGRFDPSSQTPVLVAAIVLCIVLKGVTALASQSAFAYASAQIGDDLRRRCFARVIGARQSFHDRQEPGVLLNTLATQTWRLSHGLQALSWLIMHGCAVVVFLVLMLALSWQLTLAVGAGVIVVLVVVQLATSRARRLGDEAVIANERLAARITEGLSGLGTIRLFGREAHERRRFDNASAEVRRSFFRMDVLNALPGPILEVLFAALFGILILGFQDSALVSLIVLFALLQRLQPHAAALMHARVAIMTLGGAVDNVFGVMDAQDATPLPQGGGAAHAPKRAIALNNVVIRYPGAATAALDGVSIEIPAGRTTALVGASGAGKSTVLGLICRTIDPDEGAVLVDGVDLRSIDLDDWRSRCAVVPQDVFLFNATVRENIAYGRIDAGRDKVEAAARAAHAHDFISALPEGYETRVGDRGARFSGGQRQRIALARAFIKDPDVLILDEATNALDVLSERLVRDALAEAAGSRTVLVVAHRMSSIEHADQIVVLDHGRVVETGSPAGLRAAGGAFARLFDAERLSA